MAPLEVSSVPCTIENRRRVMSHLLSLLALVTVVLSGPWPAVAGSATRVESAAAPAARAAKININTADVKELMALEGVGRSLAEKIVKHREQRGLFHKVEDLRKVDGVGSALLQKNRERIVVK
jgi:competence protein ComEA